MQNINSDFEFDAYVKLARTPNVFTLFFNSSISVKNFIETIKSHSFETFNINEQDYDIEVVVAGQYENGAPEDAPAITSYDSEITVGSFFGQKLFTQAYYVRPVRLVRSVELSSSENVSESVPNIPHPYPTDLTEIDDLTQTTDLTEEY